MTSISKLGPALGGPDATAERQRLITADEKFARRLQRALQRGTETVGGVGATADEGLKYFQPWRINRGLP
jgi:hypothetical protein